MVKVTFTSLLLKLDGPISNVPESLKVLFCAVIMLL